MLGKASEIKTYQLVSITGDIPIQISNWLISNNADVLQIQFSSCIFTRRTMGTALEVVARDSALIIYKEGESS